MSDFHDTNSWQMTISLSWTIWDWNKTKNTVRQNESQKKQLVQTRKTQEDSIRLELKKAILNLEQAEEKIPTVKKSIEQAQENLTVSELRYKVQMTIATDVLDTQELLSEAKMNYYNALYDHNLVRASL